MHRSKPKIEDEVYSGKLDLKRQNFSGEELPDPTPMAPPIGYNPQPSMIDHIRNMVRSERLRQAAEEQGFETFEEADDFDVPDDIEPVSGYENEDIFEPEPVVPPTASTGVPSSPGGEEGKGLEGAPAAEPAASAPAAAPKKPPPGPL